MIDENRRSHQRFKGSSTLRLFSAAYPAANAGGFTKRRVDIVRRREEEDDDLLYQSLLGRYTERGLWLSFELVACFSTTQTFHLTFTS